MIQFSDGSKFLYGDRCGRYSGLEKKAVDDRIPDYKILRSEAFYAAAGEPLEEGTRVGIARSGMFFDLYPFWSAFFRRLGAQVVLSPPLLPLSWKKGKGTKIRDVLPHGSPGGPPRRSCRDGCGLSFIPEVVDMEPLPWAEECPGLYLLFAPDL